MHIRSLKRLLVAVQALVHPDRITVLGSASLLATEPALGDPGQPLEISFDADLLLEPTNEETVGIVHEAVGEGSLFHRHNTVFADLLRPEIAETLPEGWKDNLVPLPDCPGVACLDPHDLALVKLSLGREKDLTLLQILLKRGILSESTLRQRFQVLPWNEHRLQETGRRMKALLDAHHRGSRPSPP